MTSTPRAIPTSFNGWNAEYLEAQYRAWKSDPSAVPVDLGTFFQGFDLARSVPGDAPEPRTNGMAVAPRPANGKTREDRAQAAVSSLIQRYREIGHLCAGIDPFGRERPCPDQLTPAWHGLTESQLDERFDAGSLSTNGEPMPLREIIATLDDTYCRSIGAEVMHITNDEERQWWLGRMEQLRNRPVLSKGERAHFLYLLHRSEMFEKFCGKRYPGVKRFSLEGGESLIPLLDAMVELGTDRFGVEEIVFAMSHRGRLNVLTNTIGKTYEQIFTEFEDAWEPDTEMGGGDVKYHRGYSANRVLPSGKQVWLAMASNPSHLESACAVAMGRVRAKQRLNGDRERSRVIPILIHGDAAFIGQGVIAENFNLSGLEGYTVGGSLHVVINNLIGFTTGEEDARTSRYCTDIAKMIEAPVLHVNGEDPEAVVHAARLALEYRMTFKKDVVIDMLCYRRHGHNETDEAMFTQPLLYKEIKGKPSVVRTYAERLLAEGVISEKDMESIRSGLDEGLDRAFESARKTPVDPTPDPGHRRWVGLSNEFTFTPVRTAVAKSDLQEVAAALGNWPEEFTPHPKLVKTLEQRARVVDADEPFDWATGEALAFGTLLIQGVLVRFSGQDSRRGTFSHRHAVLRDVNTAARYVPLNHIREAGVPGTEKDAGTVNEEGRIRQANLCIYDSPLSEYSVLGFEYGFSLASPNILVLWEAQFGDFSNGAQVIIDQFIASAEAKWKRWSGLVLLLPHGYEGQGPEHSSARIERFLKLAGQNNLQVVNPTTPAQYFHVLRRQVMRKFRKPLIIMTPKSLLRHPACTSRVQDLTDGAFHEAIDDPAVEERKSYDRVKRVLMCSGKVYYDLIERREQAGRDDIAIVRIEQLYPLHVELIAEIMGRYPKDVELYWVQEEPRNSGAWGHMALSLKMHLGWDLPYIGRDASASPATGSPRRHLAQLKAFLEEAIPAETTAPVSAR